MMNGLVHSGLSWPPLGPLNVLMRGGGPIDELSRSYISKSRLEGDLLYSTCLSFLRGIIILADVRNKSGYAIAQQHGPKHGGEKIR